jgi:hypothetical protein
MRSPVRLLALSLTAWLALACGSDIAGVRGRDPAGLRASASGTVATGADLQVTGSSNAGSPLINTAFEYTYQIKNAGPDSALSVTFADTLLNGSTVTGVFTNPEVPCTMTTTSVSCSVGTLKKGSQISIQLTVGAFTAGPLSNTGVASSSVADPVPTNNSATVTVQVTSATAGGGGKVLPTIVTAYSSLPAVFNGGGYLITGSGTALGFQFTATQSGGWQGVFASLHGSGLPGRGVCWMMADDANNPDNPGGLIAMTASVAIPAIGGALTFFPAPQTVTPIPVVAGQKYWMFCRGLANQTWGGQWDFSTDFTLQSLAASGAGTLVSPSEGLARTPAFQVNVAQ